MFQLHDSSHSPKSNKCCESLITCRLFDLPLDRCRLAFRIYDFLLLIAIDFLLWDFAFSTLLVTFCITFLFDWFDEVASLRMFIVAILLLQLLMFVLILNSVIDARILGLAVLTLLRELIVGAGFLAFVIIRLLR